MNLVIVTSIFCLNLAANAAISPLSNENFSNGQLSRQKRSPFILTALGLAGAGVVGAGLAGLAGAKIVGAGLGAKAGFAAGALAGSAARTYGGAYYYGYARPVDTGYEYKAELRVRP